MLHVSVDNCRHQALFVLLLLALLCLDVWLDSYYTKNKNSVTFRSISRALLLLLLLLLFSLALQPSAGYGLLVTRGLLVTHNDVPQSVGLLLDE
jgi:hypothetical protein